VAAPAVNLKEIEYRPFPDIPRRNFMQEAIEVPALVRLLGLPEGGDVLEVGCGRGVALPPLHLILKPRALVAIDIDADLLRMADQRVRERQVPVQLFHADVRDMPFADRSFDLVIDFGTCHHIAHPDVALREIVRVLRPGGLLISETVTSQLLSHPLRTRGRRLPWATAPELVTVRDRVLWKARVRLGRA
jgi:ubiquinone/menaquinone biosynthesis C-methylase UbiE